MPPTHCQCQKMWQEQKFRVKNAECVIKASIEIIYRSVCFNNPDFHVYNVNIGDLNSVQVPFQS